MSIRTLTVFVLFVSGLCCTAAVHASSQYSLTDLGSLGGPSYAYGINNSGKIVGMSYLTTSTSGDYRAFLYSGGSMTDLSSIVDPGGYGYSNATAINSSGQITGSIYAGAAAYCCDPSNPNSLMYIYDPNNPPTYGFSALAINDSGKIVGFGVNSAGTDGFAFSYNGLADPNAAPNSWGVNGATVTVASGINANGRIIGSYTYTASVNPTTRNTAFYTDDEQTIYSLGTLGGTDSFAYAVNAGGLIVGQSTTNSGATFGFLYDPTTHTMTNVGTPTGDVASSAFAINSAGVVVGQATMSDGTYHGFVYTGGTNNTDLNNMLVSPSNWTFSALTASMTPARSSAMASTPAGLSMRFS